MARDRELAILNPERNLWQEVLLHTIRDARLEQSFWPMPVSAYEETLDCRRYLTTPSKGLSMVSVMAGVEVAPV